jgi:hypothetical protein
LHSNALRKPSSCSRSSRKVSGLTPTAVFALATPKASLIGVGDGNYNLTSIAIFFSFPSYSLTPTRAECGIKPHSQSLCFPIFCPIQQRQYIQHPTKAECHYERQGASLPLANSPHLCLWYTRTAQNLAEAQKALRLGSPNNVSPDLGGKGSGGKKRSDMKKKKRDMSDKLPSSYWGCGVLAPPSDVARVLVLAPEQALESG